MEINGYVMEGEFSSENAGCSRWGFCRKYNHDFFIKKFTDITYPISDKLSPAILEKKRKKCDIFFQKKLKFYNLLSRCRNGNNMIIHDFFRYETSYYTVTDKVTKKTLSIKEIVALSDNKKIHLFRSILYSFAVLGHMKLVHSDVKPENILVVKTQDGYCTGKIIDFDMGFCTDDPPEDFGGDYLYYSPEVLLRIKNKKSVIGPSIDIFALGLLFCHYWTGTLPQLPDGYNYACECVADGKEMIFDSNIPADVLIVIKKMLQKNPADRCSASEAWEAFGNVGAVDRNSNVSTKARTSSSLSDKAPTDRKAGAKESDNTGPVLKVRMKSSSGASVHSKIIKTAGGDKCEPDKGHTFFRPSEFD